MNESSDNHKKKLNNFLSNIYKKEQLVTKQQTKEDKTTFSHIAFIKLKKEVSQVEKKRFIRDFKKLAITNPYIYKVSFGHPKTDLESKDDFDIAWLCHFESKDDYNRYENFPYHNEFVNKYLSYWKNVKVFDVKKDKVHYYEF